MEDGTLKPHIHEGENPYLLVVGTGDSRGVYFDCRRSLTKKKFYVGRIGNVAVSAQILAQEKIQTEKIDDEPQFFGVTGVYSAIEKEIPAPIPMPMTPVQPQIQALIQPQNQAPIQNQNQIINPFFPVGQLSGDVKERLEAISTLGGITQQ